MKRDARSLQVVCMLFLFVYIIFHQSIQTWVINDIYI